MLVSSLPRIEATMGSGLITMAAKKGLEGFSADKPTFVEVIQVGAGVKESDKDELTPLDFEVGNVLLVGPLATVRWYSDFLGAVCNIDECTLGVMQGFAENSFMAFPSKESYVKACELIEKSK